MKKKFILSLLITSIFIVSCSRIPFEVKKPVEEAALVYVYAMPAEDTERDTRYKITINGKDTKGI